ncbi:MAG: hypothetical protein P4M08_00040 [Oligoflexia bacterium]|nr:hypothetical protein [Oligoflexia bacterium]
MNRFKILKFFAFALGILLPIAAHADYDQRLSVGLGFAQLNNPSQTAFALGAEYEYRPDPMLGIGAVGNYIFANPGITFLGAPDLFLHPLATDWLLSASPIVEFGSSVGTHVGVRLGTRIPIPLGSIAIVPEFAVDIISGGPGYLFGFGIEI